MRTVRIYYPGPLNIDQDLHLDPNASKHLIKVLRFKAIDEFNIFNSGSEYLAQVIKPCHKSCQIKVIQLLKTQIKPKPQINLYQAMTKRSTDLIVEKAVELNVNSIQLVISEYTDLKHDLKLYGKKHLSLKSSIIKATEQSNRVYVPDLHPIKYFKDLDFKSSNGELNLVLNPRASIKIKDINLKYDKINVYIGPEGGFSKAEEALLSNFTNVSLTKNILRAETAAISALAYLSFNLS